MSVLETRAELLAQAASSYPEMFRRRVAETPNKVAFRFPSYTEPERWQSLTWTQSKEKVDELAAGLLSLGLQWEERVAIACSTRIEWVMLDLAIACAGGVTTTVYPNTHAEEETFILVDSNAVMLMAENAAQLVKVLGKDELNQQLRHIILIDDDRDEGLGDDPRVLTMARLQEIGREFLISNPDLVDHTVAAITPDKLSTLIYTSGTTGQPKGVELLHGTWTYEGACVKAYDVCYPDDSMYLWLPLAHVFGRDLLAVQLEVGFEAIIDGRINRLMQGVGETHPTLLIGVPRIFEKVRAAVITMYPKSGIKGRLSHWAFGVGAKSRPYRVEHKRMPAGLAARYKLADTLVFSKLREKLGGRMRLMVSGSAKLSPQVQEWLYSAGLMLVEGFGMTETAAIASINHPDRLKFGTVGEPMPGIEAVIAEDGELLMRGPIVMRGYHNLPDATAEALTPDGWLHTGDIGYIDEVGNIVITDRRKDLMKTSNGKYVAPQVVENAIMANTPYAAQAVVLGEGHKHVAALIVMDADALESWGNHHGLAGASYAELSQRPEIYASVTRFIQRANQRLQHWEAVRKFIILDRDLSLDLGEVTPSLKVRRAVVMRHFAPQIEAIYGEDSTVPWVEDLTDNEPEAAPEDAQEGAQLVTVA
ncbi:MAG: long-chain fatty acid--CoA ligase [Propionibacteriaceae bacterium]|nr:long-chain fatty acid--CoA ligase [Propionibacteriaceae bacterium]